MERLTDEKIRKLLRKIEFNSVLPVHRVDVVPLYKSMPSFDEDRALVILDADSTMKRMLPDQLYEAKRFAEQEAKWLKLMRLKQHKQSRNRFVQHHKGHRPKRGNPYRYRRHP